MRSPNRSRRRAAPRERLLRALKATQVRYGTPSLAVCQRLPLRARAGKRISSTRKKVCVRDGFLGLEGPSGCLLCQNQALVQVAAVAVGLAPAWERDWLTHEGACGSVILLTHVCPLPEPAVLAEGMSSVRGAGEFGARVSDAGLPARAGWSPLAREPGGVEGHRATARHHAHGVASAIAHRGSKGKQAAVGFLNKLSRATPASHGALSLPERVRKL